MKKWAPYYLLLPFILLMSLFLMGLCTGITQIDETYGTLLYRNFDLQGFGGIHSVFTKNCDGIFDFCNYFGKYHLSFFGV